MIFKVLFLACLLSVSSCFYSSIIMSEAKVIEGNCTLPEMLQFEYVRGESISDNFGDLLLKCDSINLVSYNQIIEVFGEEMNAEQYVVNFAFGLSNQVHDGVFYESDEYIKFNLYIIDSFSQNILDSLQAKIMQEYEYLNEMCLTSEDSTTWQDIPIETGVFRQSNFHDYYVNLERHSGKNFLVRKKRIYYFDPIDYKKSKRYLYDLYYGLYPNGIETPIAYLNNGDTIFFTIDNLIHPEDILKRGIPF